MATKIWVSTTGDFTAAASWSDSVAPASGDTLIFDGSSQQAVTTNLSNPLLDNITLRIGPASAANFGSSGSPLELGTGASIRYETTLTKQAFLKIGGGTIRVYRASTLPNACVVDGVVATLYVVAGGHVNVLPTAALTNFYSLTAQANTTIESGATVTNAYMDGGTVNCSAVVGTLVEVNGGVWNQLSVSSGTLATLDLYGGRFIARSARDLTVTTLNAIAGVFDARGNHNTNTISGGQVRARAVVDLTDSNVTATLTRRGGRIIGGNVTITEDVEEATGNLTGI